MWRHTLCTVVTASALLVACGKKEEPAPAAPASAANMAAPMPDVGKLETVTVTAQGFGRSASEAVAEAMKLAILQVNGASIDSESVSVKYGLDVALNQDSASLRASGFADAVRQRSGGVIQNFKILELAEPGLMKGPYKARIEAGIARFTAPQDLKKIKLVVAPLRFPSATLPMGDQSMASAEVGAALRQRIADALVNTGRFAVLDREFSAEIEQELEIIGSGKAPSAEMAKLAQSASADVIWIGKVTALGYHRRARQLKTSDRELVSYDGGWSISQKLVNVATRQMMLSDTLGGTAPATEATTLSRGVDSRKILDSMSDDLVNQVVASVLRRTFPITVVSRDGSIVVLSQGGQALREGARYAMVTMGAEMKDPQTGQSLGRTESPCCELVVDKVTPNLSYGHLESVRASLDNLPVAALQLREELRSGPARVAGGPAEPGAPALAPARPGKAAPQGTTAPVESPPPAKADDKW
ncbi:MAG: hypothetical protein KAZ63_01310 [Vitreoscilla sp.]|nr:hypothetical protein [Vitreoscilla sp.]